MPTQPTTYNPMYQNPGMNGELAFIDPLDPNSNANRGAPGQQRQPAPARVPTPPANQEPAPMPAPMPAPPAPVAPPPPMPGGFPASPITMAPGAPTPMPPMPAAPPAFPNGQTLYPAAMVQALQGPQATSVNLSNVSLPAAPGQAPPPGWRREIMADGSPGGFQQILPEEMGPGGIDLMRRGTSLAEIQQMYPGLDITQQMRIRQGNIDAAVRGDREAFGIPGEIARQNQRFAGGVMTDAQRQGISQFGVNPVATPMGGTSGAMTQHTLSGQGAIDQMIAQASAAGASPTDLAGLVSGFRTARTGGIPPQPGVAPPPGALVAPPTPIPGVAQGGPPSAGGTTPPPAPTATEAPRTPPAAAGTNPQLEALMRRTLLGIPGSGADVVPGQPFNRPPLTLPATYSGNGPNAAAGRDAITNFVHSANAAGLLNQESLPAVMNYMTQVFGAGAVDPWFQQTRTLGPSFFGSGSSGPQFEAIDLISNLANQRVPGAVGQTPNAYTRGMGVLNLRTPYNYLAGLFGGGG